MATTRFGWKNHNGKAATHNLDEERQKKKKSKTKKSQDEEKKAHTDEENHTPKIEAEENSPKTK